MASCKALCSITWTLPTVFGVQPGSAPVDRLAAATLQQVGVKVVELDRGERLELHLAEDWLDVGGDVGTVVGPGGGAQSRLHRREPFFLQEVAEGVGGALGEPTGSPLADGLASCRSARDRRRG